MPSKPKTIDEYLAGLPRDQRTALEAIRQVVRAVVPRGEECISYGVPAFRVDGKVLVGFGAASRHCTFYPMSGTITAAHEAELAGYETSKGAIHFPAERPLPGPLVRKLVKWRLAEMRGGGAGRPEMRRDDEPPAATGQWGWRYHHAGIPTRRRRPGERYLARFKMYVSGFSGSPYGVEWMRFEAASPVSELVRSVPHVAFEVDDLDEALEGKRLLSAPGSPSAGVRAAMILHDGCPIELLEFAGKKRRAAAPRARGARPPAARPKPGQRKRGEP